MAVSFASYEIARSGLLVNERSLNVTGHNISNVNTPGYVRQQAIMTTGPYHSVYGKSGIYQLGLGAEIQQIRQIRHSFLDNIYRQENINLGYWETRNKTFQDVQAILGEPLGSGLQNVMNQFWDAWQELSKEPDSLTVRALVRQRGGALVQSINHIGTQLDKLQSDLNSEIRVRIDEVNQITEQIAKLNVTILKSEITGDTANDYRDQRNTLIDRLSKLVNAEVTEMQDGQVSVTLGGYFLVSKGIRTRLSVGESQPGSMYYVPKLEGTDIEVPIHSGIIKGLMESRGEVSGAKGSVENGTPNTKTDIVFAVDVSDSSAANLAKIQASISKYIQELKDKGIDYNLRLITFDGTGVISNTPYGNDTVSFSNAINLLSATGDTGNDFGSVVAELNDPATTFRQDANKYAIVFTAESMDGDGVNADAAVGGYISTLEALGIKTSMVTGSAYFTDGEAGEASGWNEITDATGGKLYDIDTPLSEFNDLMADINNDICLDVSYSLSTVQQSDNIVPDLKRRLNALVNIMAREVNYLHKSGKTLGNPPSDGQDFFTTIDSNYPLEMGNIRLNPIFADSNGLNNIVASQSGSSGDNTIALKIANLRHAAVTADITGILSMDEYYQSIILNVGNNGSDAARISESQYKLVQSADAYRQSITGVSMDEEMTNMMKYKYAYNASSRVINVVDEMIETIISRMGLAGR